MIDLADFTFKDEATMTLLHPVTRKPMGEPGALAQITVASTDSAQYREAFKAAVAWYDAESAAGNTPDEREQSIFLAAGMIKSWQNVSFKGAEIPCNGEYKTSLLRQLPWLLTDVQNFASSRANFTKD